jgi:uncharacterized protein involved in response to NO
MHLAYGWLLLSFLVRALGELGAYWPADTSLHVFLLGAFSLLQLGLMSRVALRHTGRMVVLPLPIQIAIWLMLIAAVLRFVAVAFGMYGQLIMVSAICWSICWILYLICFARILLTPSLPRPVSAASDFPKPESP